MRTDKLTFQVDRNDLRDGQSIDITICDTADEVSETLSVPQESAKRRIYDAADFIARNDQATAG